MKGKRTKSTHATELSIAQLLYKVGAKTNDTTYCAAIPTTLGKCVEFDGRICFDDYEDLPSYARCLVTSVFADEKTDHVWFRACTGFSTHFPSAEVSNYNLLILPGDAKDKIFEHLSNLPTKNKKTNFKREWVKLAEKFLEEREWPNGDNSYKAGFMHSVDCWFCCENSLENAEYAIPLYKERLDITTMIAIKMVYADYDTFLDETYLSNQHVERKLIQMKFIKEIMNHVWATIPQNFINELYLKDPAQELKRKGRVFEFKVVHTIPKQTPKQVKIYNHKPKDSYSSKDIERHQTSLSNIWIDATYVLKTDVNSDMMNYEYIPVLLKDIKFIYKPKFEKRSLEQDTYSLGIDFNNLFGYETMYGSVNIVLTLENLLNHTEFEFRYLQYGAHVNSDGSTQYLMQLKHPYRYPACDNEFINNECKKIVDEANEEFIKFANSLRQDIEDPGYSTIVVDNLEWATENVVETYKDKLFDETRTICESSINWRNVFMWLLPIGYRLPTVKELQSLLENHPFAYDKKGFYKNDVGMKIHPDNRWSKMHHISFWTSDTVSGKFIDNVKLTVNINGTVNYQRACQESNQLLLIKE